MADDPDLGPASELKCKAWLTSTGAVWPSTSGLTSLNLSFLITQITKVVTLTPIFKGYEDNQLSRFANVHTGGGQ